MFLIFLTCITFKRYWITMWYESLKLVKHICSLKFWK